jgi:hypothetical protein
MIEAPQNKITTINNFYHFNISNSNFNEFMKALSLSLSSTFDNTAQVNSYFILNKKRKEPDYTNDEEKGICDKTTNKDEKE